MSQLEKLTAKLESGQIDGPELMSLLGRLGWWKQRQKGSHQFWTNGKRILVLIADRRNLKPYQIKDAQDAILGGKAP